MNAGAICIISLLVYDIFRNLRAKAQGQNRQDEGKETKNNSQLNTYEAHSALNIALFPPLFFFSGLYYTDVISTLLVLVAYNAYLKKGQGNWKGWDEVIAVLVGIMALLFRQTNIFWVAIFPAGLATIDTLEKAEIPSSADAPKATSDLSNVISSSWKEGRIHNCPVSTAAFQGTFFSTFKCNTAYLTAARLRATPTLGCNSHPSETIHSCQSHRIIRFPRRNVHCLRGLERRCCPRYCINNMSVNDIADLNRRQKQSRRDDPLTTDVIHLALHNLLLPSHRLRPNFRAHR